MNPTSDMAALLAFMTAHFWPLWWLCVIGFVLRFAGVEAMAQRMGRKP